MDWPPHETESRPWSTAADARSAGGRRPPREDRELKQITVSIPPAISDLDPRPDPATVEAIDRAQTAAVRLDATAGEHLAALSGFLLRSESVASSKIERINADSYDTAKAFAGLEAGRDALLTAASAAAVTALISTPRPLSVDAICHAHRTLLADDPVEGRAAGQTRSVQNWIGGSDFTPRNAVYVPPPASQVDELLDDLVRFAGRTDVGTIAQAAIVHAQFESIHPFNDGNGRVGRALINTVLRHRGVTDTMVIPAASVMLADTDRYFGCLDRYRTGDANAFICYLADAIFAACAAATESSDALATLRGEWRIVAKPRAKSSADRLIDVLLTHPVVTTATAQQLVGTTAKATAGGLSQLEDVGVLTEITGAGRDRVWVAGDVIDELDRLNERIGDRVRPTV